MGWGGINLIPRLPGESRQAAVNRVYAGGEEIEFHADGTASWNRIPGEERDVTRVSRANRAWMLGAIERLRSLAHWKRIEENKEPGRRWPWCIVLEHESTFAFAIVYTDHLTLRLPREAPQTVENWRAWWKLIQTFVREDRCVAFHPDDDTILATSMSADAARRRYYYF